jgi:hypothetical protein
MSAFLHQVAKVLRELPPGLLAPPPASAAKPSPSKRKPARKAGRRQ